MITAPLMRDRARALLASLSIQEPPVDVEAIAKGLDFKVLRSSLPPNLAGVMRIKGTMKTIGVNAAHSITKQRFTVAHELGHYVGAHEDYHATRSETHVEVGPSWASSRTPQEREADEFAAELLMPERFLRKDLERGRRYGLKELARRYDVSPQAMVIQVTDLELQDVLEIPTQST
jgi:Zn-dependent peptidase ImmA (M78 family)